MNILDLMRKFSTQKKCLDHLEKVRWNGKIKCVYCTSDKVCKHIEKNKKRLQCWNCNKSFSVTVGTIFHHTHIDLQKWFSVMSLMLNAKKGLSSCQIARDLGMRQPTVWSMMGRIRKAMRSDQASLLTGIVEMDETYVSGKHNKRGRGTKKQAVVGMIEREGDVKTHAASENKMTFGILFGLVKKNVDTDNAILYTRL